MQPSMKFLVSACSIVALAACARTNGQKAADEANQKIQQVKKEMDDSAKAAKDAAKAGDEAAKQASDAYEKALDENASGSQPGQILLYGALSDGQKPSAQITVTQTTGQGWRGTSPELIKNALILEKRIAVMAKPPLGDVINVGCDLSKFPEAKDLKAKELQKTETETRLVAELVLVCDDSLSTSQSLSIRTNKLVLSGAKIQAKGITGVVLMDIKADELVLEGENKISSLAIDGSTTMFAGPQLNASVETISGSGKLTIESKGASYVEKK